MPEKELMELETEKQDIKEFIKLFQNIPKDKRYAIKYIMIGISLMNQTEELPIKNLQQEAAQPEPILQ